MSETVLEPETSFELESVEKMIVFEEMLETYIICALQPFGPKVDLAIICLGA
jgi:hypothetical protein